MRRVLEAIDYGASELCIQSGIHPDWGLEDYLAGCASPSPPRARRAASCTCTPTRRWRSPTCATSPRYPHPRCSLSCATLAWTRPPAPPPRCSTTGCASASRPTSCPCPLGGDHRSLPRRRPALDLHGHVRPHRGAVGACRAHARHSRAATAHRRHHRVRAALVHPVSNSARTHAWGGGDLAGGEPQAHRRVPLALGRHHPEPAGFMGEDGPRRRHRVVALGCQRPRGHA